MTHESDLHPFDSDTAVEPLGKGRYRAEIRESWWVGRGPNGGYIGAILMRAIQAEVPGRPPRSLTVHFPLPPGVGPAEVEVRVERAGRSASFFSARLTQNGETKSLALAALSENWAGLSYEAAVMPEAKPPEELHEFDPTFPGVPKLLGNYRVIPALGEYVFTGGEVPRSGGWIRAKEPRALDAPLVVAIMDAWFPVPFVRTTGPFPAPTLDFTVHFRSPLPPAGAAPEDFYLADFHSALARDGFFEEDGELWSAGGTLLAQSRQLGLLLGSAPESEADG